MMFRCNIIPIYYIEAAKTLKRMFCRIKNPIQRGLKTMVYDI